MGCEGTGFETERLGGMVSRKVCGYCEGTKMFVKMKCHECRGTGQTIVTFEQFVDIPPACEDGQILRMDIHPEILKWTIEHHDHFFLKLSVDEHPTLRKDGLDVISEEDISVAQALLGGELFCSGLNESTVILNIDSERSGGVGVVSSSHSTLVAPDEGIPSGLGGIRGNHLVTVGIRVPRRLTPKQRHTLLEVFGQETLDNGWADGCLEPDHAHKMKVGLVEPTHVYRPFGRERRKSMKERYQDEDRRVEQSLTEAAKDLYHKYKEFRSS